MKVQKHFPRVVFAEELCQGGRWGGATCISAGLVSFTKPVSATGWHLKGPHWRSCRQKKPLAEQKFLAPFCMRSSRLVLPRPSWRRFRTQRRGHLTPQLGCSQGFRMHGQRLELEAFVTGAHEPSGSKKIPGLHTSVKAAGRWPPPGRPSSHAVTWDAKASGCLVGWLHVLLLLTVLFSLLPICMGYIMRLFQISLFNPDVCILNKQTFIVPHLYHSPLSVLSFCLVH